jgi:hypothetical protein
MERLNAELTINLSMTIDRATHDSYSSALNSYLTFCRLHNINIEPTERTLALYLTFQSTYINPKSVDSYLSGIANQLESHFPNVRVARKSALVSCALQGAKHCFGTPTTRKLPLTKENLLTVYNAYQVNPSHDDILFMTQLLTGTECLMCLGELAWPDKLALRDYRKVCMCHTVTFHTDALSFWLPGHKVDHFFEGNRLIVHKSGVLDTFTLFTISILSRSFILRSTGTMATCRWNHTDLIVVHQPSPSFFPNIDRRTVYASRWGNCPCRSRNCSQPYSGCWLLDLGNVQPLHQKKPVFI